MGYAGLAFIARLSELAAVRTRSWRAWRNPGNRRALPQLWAEGFE